MEFDAILAISGAVLLIIAIIGGGVEAKEIKVPALSKSIRILAAVIGVILLIIGYIISNNGNGTSVTDNNHIAAVFLQPATGTGITLNTTLKGSVKPAYPKNSTYWIILRDDDNDHYPHGKLSVRTNGQWSYSLSIGPVWKERTLSAIIILASPDTSEDLTRMKENNEDWPQFPGNAKVLEEREFIVR